MPAYLRLLVLALFSATLAHASALRSFAPQGTVDQQTRATAVFASDMVRLGDAGAQAPFEVNCGGVKGSGRWVDGRTWAWQLERPLQVGERCEFSLRAGLTDLAGSPLQPSAQKFSFAPAGLALRSIFPRPGNGIEEDQAFVLEANAALKRASVEKNVWCEAESVGNRIPVRLLSGKERDEVLAQVYGDAKSAGLVVTCADRLPSGGKMQLVWGAGVEAENGSRSTRQSGFAYPVREAFKATFTCEREKADRPCSPFSALTLQFSSEVSAKAALSIRLKGSGGFGSRSPASTFGPGNPQASTLSSISFPGPFPENSEFTLELPSGLKDDAGRPLSNAQAFPLKIKTGPLPPLAKFPGDFGIVELKEGGLLPVTLRNVESPLRFRTLQADKPQMRDQRLVDDASVIETLNRLKRFEQQTRHYRQGNNEVFDPYYARELPFLTGGGVEKRELPKPGGSAEFEVVGVPLGKPGLHIVEIESRLLGAALLATPKPMYVRTAALVTNLSVHLKVGKDNGLVWVTALDTAKPVEKATVRISNGCGEPLWQGVTDAQGRALVDKALASAAKRSCGENFFFASARLGEDYSFVRSDWNEGIEPWRFGVDTWGETSPRKYHTIMDRTLFRPGQTVSMKHLARERNSRGFFVPDAAGLPDKLTIRHLGSDTEFSQPLRWEANGVAISQWKVPEGAQRGEYSVELSSSKARNRYDSLTETGHFSVSDFRLPVFTGSIQGVPARQFAPKEVPLALGLSFLNGGAAKNTPVSVSATLRPRWIFFEHYAGYEFQLPFSEEALSAFKLEKGDMQEALVLDKAAVTLDKAGAGKLAVKLPKAVSAPMELYSEMSFNDPNGEVQTVRGTVELWPAAISLGVKVGDWMPSAGQKGSVQVVALDIAGKPQPGIAVKVVAKRQVDYAHRRRIVGGFYSYEQHSEFEDLGTICQGKTDARGLLSCTVKDDKPGNVLVLATADDGQGHSAMSGSSYWVSGGGDTWFTAGNQDRIDVVPEKRSYAPGETAKFQVRTPFREATALVSVEADGVLDTQVISLSRFKPVIELPVKGEWGPNAYVSVLVVRGRVQPLTWLSFFDWGWREPINWFKEWWSPDQPTAMVDLAKPAYRIGLAEIEVGKEAFRLKVDVTADKKDYRPRETATVQVKVTTPDGKPLPAGSEIALAAVDQALLELRGNDSWNLLDALVQKRAYQVETATAQGQVIGKRHFGRKAVPAGGGGGRAPARELLDTLLVWNPRVRLDENGLATLKVPLNDSLTEFRVVAIAQGGSSLFGTGSTTLRTKQDLQMISGLPPQVRENDRYTALLTLRNGTAKAMEVAVSAKVGEQSLEKQKVHLEPEGAAELSWSAKAPEGQDSLQWEFEASDTAGSAKDRLRITQQVSPAVPVTVQQASFTRIDGKVDLPLTLPPGALPGKGGVEVALSSRISNLPPGVGRFFEEYPYGCLEQRTSIAVGLRDGKRWQAVADGLPTYLDGNGLARYFPGDAPGSVALTAYLLDVTKEAGFTLPEAAQARMEQGLTSFVEGRFKRETRLYRPLGEDLLAQKLTALEALTRLGRTPLAAASSLDVEPSRLATGALIDWYLVVKRLNDLPQRAGRLAQADRELRNRLSYTGGRLSFTTEKSDFWWWAMVNGDSNAFRLIDAVMDEPGWQEDLPALVQGAVQRQVRGRWLTTVANVWATLSLDKFARKFEKDQVKGTTRLQISGGEAKTYAWKGDKAEVSPKLALPWPPKLAADGKLGLSHEGNGKPWAHMQVLAAMPASENRSFGYRISRSVTPVQEKEKGKVSRGDVWRVTLVIDAEQEMDWVVVNDPIPAGARILGDGDGRDSQIAQQGERQSGNAWPTYMERTFGGLRAYYEYVPRGRFRVEYTVRLNNAGEFAMPPTRVEAMYAPDVFGEIANGKVTVGN